MKDDEILDKFVQRMVIEDSWNENEKCSISKCITDPSELAHLYMQLSIRFPPLFERLLLAYRWPRADVGEFKLLANLHSKNFQGLYDEIFQDKHLSADCLKNGYVQLGFAHSYDLVCFDTNQKSKGRDFPIVRLDHEQILCWSRVKVVTRISPSFREFVIGRLAG